MTDGTLKGIKTVEVDSSFKEIEGTEKEWEGRPNSSCYGFLGS